MFDDFLRELQERQRRAAGEPEPADRARWGPAGRAGGVCRGRGGRQRARRPPGAGITPGEAAPEAPATADEAGEAGRAGGAGEPEPEALAARRRIGVRRRGAGRGAPPPPRRTAGGPTDGGGFRASARRLGPQMLLVVVALLLFAIVLLLSFGIDLTTDAIWFHSVGFDPVFWTRLGSRSACSRSACWSRSLFLLRNLWLAGRLAPPPGAGPAERVRGLVGRLGEAARHDRGTAGPERRVRSRRGPLGGTGDEPPARASHRSPSRPRRCRTSRRSPSAALVVVAVLAALGTAGALSGSWETVLLWQNRVPFAAAGAAAGRRPDLRARRLVLLLRAAVPAARSRPRSAGCSWPALIVAGGRYLARRERGGGGFPTPVRVHLGVLGGLYLLTVAAGYQLDKLELVYSTRGRRHRRQLHGPGRPVLRLRRADDRGRPRRRAPRRRRVHPLDLAARGGDRRLVRPVAPPRAASTRR